MTRIIVDSTCDMPKAFIEAYGIIVLPLHVPIGGVGVFFFRHMQQ